MRFLHGHSKSKFYNVWGRIKDRTTNPNSIEWDQYGGRGITLYPPWENYLNFFFDMYPSYRPGLYIDRIDNDRGYNPYNCRWVTNKENNRNKSTNVRYRGRCIVEWAEIWGISFQAAKNRVQLLKKSRHPSSNP